LTSKQKSFIEVNFGTTTSFLFLPYTNIEFIMRDEILIFNKS